MFYLLIEVVDVVNSGFVVEKSVVSAENVVESNKTLRAVVL